MSLVLKRKKGESIFIDGATVSILHLGKTSVTFGIVAPREMKVLRSEIIEADHDVLTRDDRKRDSYIARLRGMDEAKRNRLIAAIIKEFCAPKAATQTVAAGT